MEKAGYTDDKCPGESRWACCNRKRFGDLKKRAAKGWICQWLGDTSSCQRRICCYPDENNPNVPDEFCPDLRPVRKNFRIWDEIGDWLAQPVFGPATGGASAGGAGAAGAAAAGGGGGAGLVGP